MSLQDKIKSVKDEDFLPGLFDSWSIYIKENEYCLEKIYMNVDFESEKQAEDEKSRVIKHRIKQNLPAYFSIVVKSRKVRRLKNPISVG